MQQNLEMISDCQKIVNSKLQRYLYPDVTIAVLSVPLPHCQLRFVHLSNWISYKL